MGIDSRTAFAVVIAAQAILLALAIAVFLHGERHPSIPAAIPAAHAPGAAVAFVPDASVPVQYAAPAVGTTRSTTAALVRGGPASSSATAGRDAGVVGYRRSTTARVRSVGAATPSP